MPYKREPSFIELNPEYNIIYYQLLKDGRVWTSCGQYWLAKEANRRANALLTGDLDQYKIVKHSHDLYFKKYYS